MDITELKKQRQFLIKKKDDISYERKQFLKEYNDLKDIVKKTGSICLVCFVLQIIIVSQFLDSKNVTILALGRYLTPFVLGVFIAALVVFLTKGFNLFINADTDWSKKAAEKLERTRFTEKLESMNELIIRIDIELNKIDDKLKELGTNIDDIDFETEEEKVIHEKPTYKKTVEKKAIYEQKTGDNVDDLLNALDSWGLNDDEDDEFENSSELWKKDSKILG